MTTNGEDVAANFIDQENLPDSERADDYGQTPQEPPADPQSDQTSEQLAESSPTEPTIEQTEETSPEQKVEDNHYSQVNGVNTCWPDRIVVAGLGLSGGAVGTDFYFHIDARKGGPGVLAARCAGPSRSAHCELNDHQNGTFTLVVRPEETGDHVLEVKYEDQPVEGSPFTFKVTPNARPDPKKVRVSGPGVENGILSSFQSNFVVDTMGAGSGNLSVRMQGPRGAFLMQMYRENESDRKVLCQYNPTLTGIYIIFVKWSGVNVPGSPFQVKVFDSEFEMEKDAKSHN